VILLHRIHLLETARHIVQLPARRITAGQTLPQLILGHILGTIRIDSQSSQFYGAGVYRVNG
jgi:hypothetical protein